VLCFVCLKFPLHAYWAANVLVRQRRHNNSVTHASAVMAEAVGWSDACVHRISPPICWLVEGVD